MSRLTIRTRLVLWFSGIVLAGVSLLAIVLYLRFDRTLEQFLKEHLAHEAEHMLGILRAAPDRAHLESLLAGVYGSVDREYDFFIRILDADRVSLFRTPGMREGALPFPDRVPRGIGSADPAIETAHHPFPKHRRHRVRVFTCRVTPGWSRALPDAAYLQIAQPTRRMERRLASLEAHEITGIAGLLLFAGLAGWLLMRKALRPVADITAQAASIDAADLDTRLPLRGTGDELDRLAEVLNGMFERLHAAFARNRRFAAAAAHQLRTPLTTMRAELDLLAGRGDLTPELQAMVDGLRDDVERMTSLCRRMLLLMKVEAEAGPPSRIGWNPVELASVCHDLALGARERADGKKVRLTFHDPATEVHVLGNAEILGEAIHNLIENAIKYTPAGGRVDVHLAADGDTAVLTVEDTGRGITDAAAERLFEEFARGASTAADATGFGLGLPIARGVIERHGGSITLSRRSGGGTVFTVRLPRIDRRA